MRPTALAQTIHVELVNADDNGDGTADADDGVRSVFSFQSKEGTVAFQT